MKWILFTGTWRLADKTIESDVRKAVREVFERDDGIVNGGATGVDYFTMDEAFKIDPTCSKLQIIIPTDLDSFIEDHRKNWCLPPITQNDIDTLALLLQKIRAANPHNFVEMPFKNITQEHYNLRHAEEVKRSDEVYAFHVNDSPGTQNTIDQAREAGLTIALHRKYKI